MKIIKQGKKKVTARRVTCYKCDCVFEYERADLQETQIGYHKPWVYCPCCNSGIEVEYWKDYDNKDKKKNSMKRIFLSGAISYYIASGQWESRKAEFRRVKQLLEQKGWQVVSPLDLNLRVDLPHDRCMDETMKQLAYCHAIFLMDGWEKSTGCRDELNMALTTGKEIYLENVKKYDVWKHSLKP